MKFPSYPRWGTMFACALWILLASSARASSLTDLLLRPGPFGSGLAELDLEDTTRPTPPNGTFPGAPSRPLPTTVWYPAADPAADEQPGAEVGRSARGFPLIVFGHGIALSGAEGSFVASHLAKHGYVVVAPDFPLSKGNAPGGPTATDIPGQARDVLFLTELFQDPTFQMQFPPASSIDFDRIGLLGYSLGGATVALAGSDPSIDAVATLAPAICPLLALGETTHLDKPLLILQGTTDLVVPPAPNSQVLFDMSGRPKQLVTIENGSHGGFFTNALPLEATLPPDMGIDSLLCQVLTPTLGTDPTAQTCGLCDPPTTGPQVPVARQQDLTRAGVLAFFNGHLRCSLGSLAFLTLVYGRANDELDSTFSGRFGQGLRECLVQ